MMEFQSPAAAKPDYVAPKLTLVGSFEQITQRTGSGNHLDATYPYGTPRGNIFS
jgi:hypothetical protein